MIKIQEITIHLGNFDYINELNCKLYVTTAIDRDGNRGILTFNEVNKNG